jgi:pyruvate ferredoxin oxidoreductase delta subunit
MLIDENKIKNDGSKGVPYCEAGVEKNMATWRTYTPVIDYKKCIKCLVCWLNCPDVAYRLEKGTPRLVSKNCKGCGICIEHCPVKCISKVKK